MERSVPAICIIFALCVSDFDLITVFAHKNDARQCHFAEIQGVYLNVSSKTILKASSLVQCTHRCLQDNQKCVAVNYKKISVDNEENCDLLYLVLDDSTTPFIKDSKWIYLEKRRPVREVIEEHATSMSPVTVEQSTCKKYYEHGEKANGAYTLQINGQRISVYCDMANGGWTLISRFSNKDSINWMLTSGQWWYDKTSCTGACDSTSTNADMINEGFFLTKGNEIKLTRSDDSIHKALLITTSSCLGGSTFRGKLTSYGNFRNGVVWSSNKCLGNCTVTYGPGAYQNTAGFSKHSCNGNIQSSNKIGFWCDWSSGDGSVLMIGGGGSACGRADHGVGITEENAAKFGGSQKKLDFGNDPAQSVIKSYAINMWIK